MKKTPFEQAAHDIQKKVRRPSFDHTIETYSNAHEEEHMTVLDAMLLTALGIIILLGIMAITK